MNFFTHAHQDRRLHALARRPGAWAWVLRASWTLILTTGSAMSWAYHVLSDPYPATSTRPDQFIVACPDGWSFSPPALTAGGLAYLNWSTGARTLAQVAQCQVAAFLNSDPNHSASLYVAIPLPPLPVPPSAFQVTP